MQTKMRHTTSICDGSLPTRSAPLRAAATAFGTSFAPSQLMMGPSDSAPASISIFSRSAAM